MNKNAKGRPATGRQRFQIMCHPSRIDEVRAYIKKLKPKPNEINSIESQKNT